MRLESRSGFGHTRMWGLAARAKVLTRPRLAVRVIGGNAVVPERKRKNILIGGLNQKLTEVVQLWQIFTSSSYTNSTHRRLGASNSLIWGFTSKSNAISGTNRLGLGPVELRIAVRISWFSRLCVASMEASAAPKMSLNM